MFASVAAALSGALDVFTNLKLLGEHQVVIKSLETNFRRVAGVSGATIMGDGGVALILVAGALGALGSAQPLAKAA